MADNNTQVIILPERGCGNTTRQIDDEIQRLFSEKSVLVQDHADRRDHNGNPLNMAHEHHLRTLLRRLDSEHGLSDRNYLSYNRKTRVLTLKI